MGGQPSRMVLPFMLPFMQRPIAWTVWGPPCSAYTPQRVLRSFEEAMAQCILPWKPKCPRELRWIWYVDAAKSPVGFLGAVWGTEPGCRIEVLPKWVQS